MPCTMVYQGDTDRIELGGCSHMKLPISYTKLQTTFGGKICLYFLRVYWKLRLHVAISICFLSLFIASAGQRWTPFLFFFASFSFAEKSLPLTANFGLEPISEAISATYQVETHERYFHLHCFAVSSCSPSLTLHRLVRVMLQAQRNGEGINIVHIERSRSPLPTGKI